MNNNSFDNKKVEKVETVRITLEEYQELKNYRKGFGDLVAALQYYVERSNKVIKTSENKAVRIQYRGMCYVYKWILNSMGSNKFILHLRHAANITKCLYKDLEFHDFDNE